MKYDIFRATANAHLDVLDELSRKMRSKTIMMEDKQEKHSFTYSFNLNQALILFVNMNISKYDPYEMSVIQEISDPIWKALLQ